jgi:MoaA/NifB/PqqE/SkfB family radical SAM enzyme
MFEILWKLPVFMMMRRFGWPHMLPVSVTIVPSPRCNSRCLTCNIWKKSTDEFTLEEWDRTFQSLGTAPYWFTISGGEPFMQDIVAISQSLYKHCKPGIINIPTNSLLYKTIPEKIESICNNCPDSQIILNLSLDGVGEKHDRIRGVPGNFDKVIANYHALRELKCKNLAIGIHSVISNFNIDDAAELFDFGLALEPDSYITEIAEQRVELDTMGMDITPSSEQYAQVIDGLMARIQKRKFHGISKVTEAFRVRYYNLVKQVLTEKTQVIPCYAGWASAQIYSDGQVWPCCVRGDNMTNLRDVDYNFKRVWFSPEAKRIRQSIYNKECHCPLANASYTNMLMHVATLVEVAARVALK